jgi:hypothetical protein
MNSGKEKPKEQVAQKRKPMSGDYIVNPPALYEVTKWMHDEHVIEFKMGDFSVKLGGPRPTFMQPSVPPEVTTTIKNDGLTDDERFYGVGAAEWQR